MKKKKTTIVWMLMFIILVGVIALGFSVFMGGKKEQSDMFPAITSIFNTSKGEKGNVSDKNDMSVWWVSDDNLNIINDDSRGIEFQLNTCESDVETLGGFRETAQKLGGEVDVVMKKAGWKANIKNVLPLGSEVPFDDYILAYEIPDKKCVFVANPDCMRLKEEESMHYTFSFACTDVFAFEKNYEEQAPFLRDLQINDAVIHVAKRNGDYVMLNVNYRRSGHYTMAKLVDGKWTELISGQDIPSCTLVKKFAIPNDIAPSCQ